MRRIESLKRTRPSLPDLLEEAERVEHGPEATRMKEVTPMAISLTCCPDLIKRYPPDPGRAAIMLSPTQLNIET